MCKAQVILETIKKTKGKGGMTALQIELANAQAEDYRDMKREITSIKSDMNAVKNDLSEVKRDLASVTGKLDLLIKQGENKPLLTIILELIKNKYFWLVVSLIVIGVYGLDLSGLKGLF
ncbi:MAG: hypothetical protein IJ525_00780 [Alphaproteobacteria bacterium]|nr:hypothetical protein [Alphaproteobacteria bacterium]